jgi:hypothetical protein
MYISADCIYGCQQVLADHMMNLLAVDMCYVDLLLIGMHLLASGKMMAVGFLPARGSSSSRSLCCS